ncbi:MAG: hypothetical protein WC702_00695 [Patescibacteria group bacterium]|jgi:hypothetical protein
MSWLKIIGWFLFLAPFIGFIGFSIWMILSVMNDDDNIKAFVSILVISWVIGLAILLLSYFTNFASLAGF